DNCTGDHAAARVAVSFAFNNDHATSHPVAGTGPGVTANDDGSAAHADRLAGERSAEPVPGIAGDREGATRHAGRRPRTGIPGNGETTALHQAARLDTDVALDTNFALAHAGTDAVEALAAPLEADLRNIAHTDLERIAGEQTFARRL